MGRASSHRPARALACVVGALTLLASLDCAGQGSSVPADTSPSGAQTTDGIPAPPAGLEDTSPPSAFFAYADSLQFTTDSASAAILSRRVGDTISVLTVSSETRLPNTPDSAYARGRIIARFQTTGAASVFGVPPGEAYLWVRLVSGNHVGTLIWRSEAGDSGKIPVASELHPPRADPAGVPLCVASDTSTTSVPTDTLKMLVCCRCGTGRYNCPSSVVITEVRLRAMLALRGM